MPCYNPRPVWMPPFGGRPKFKNPKQSGYVQLVIACGECLSCLSKYSLGWAVRQHCEATTAEIRGLKTGRGENLFVTFTYNNENLPEFGHYNYPHIQRTIRTLRQRLGRWATRNQVPKSDMKFTYCVVPEYGDKNFRPHYHANIFGITLPDLEAGDPNNRGNFTYKSKILQEAWGLGIIDIQPYDYGAGMYIGNHNVKQTGEPTKLVLKQRYHAIKERIANENLETFGEAIAFEPETGEIYPDKIPLPRIYASSRPAIGRTWYDQYNESMWANGFVTIKGNRYPIPKYFERVLFDQNPQKWAKIALKRREKTYTYTPEQLATAQRARQHKREFFGQGAKRL